MNHAQIDILGEKIVDSFAGGGGTSTGIELATGRAVDFAINHDPDAILMHQTNHPHTVHYQASVWDVDPVEVCGGSPVGLFWASPDCKHFSKAKGGKPVDKKIRGLAWIVLRWAGKVHPRVIILENVEEFQTWGPVRRGKPVKSKAGQTFRQFVRQLEALGYAVSWRELVAADYGAPTTRKRFFLIARRDGRPIVWPEPTHAPADSPDVQAGKKKPWRSAAEIIDWSLPCPSIFDTRQQIKEKYGLTAQRPLRPNTMRRVARGIDKFVIKSAHPFLIQCNHGGGFRGQELKEPLPAITAKHGYGLSMPVMVAIGQTNGGDRGRSVREPTHTQVSKAEECVVSAKLNAWTVTNTTNSTGHPVTEPMDTARTGGGGGQMLTAASMIQYHTEQNEGVRGQEITEPLRTIDAANRYGLTAALMVKYYSGDHAQDVKAPLHTVTTKDREGVVAASLSEFYGASTGGCPRGPQGRLGIAGGDLSYSVLIEEVLAQPILQDVDGGQWIPVNAEALHELVENYAVLEEKTQKAVQWIGVEKGLPSKLVPVIVCRRNGKVETGILDVNGWWKVYGTRTKDVTHWMPLPERPACYISNK